MTNVHRVIRFNQRNWLKRYIDFNTELRQKAKTNFEKDFFKLKNFPALNLSQQNGEEII